MHENTMRSEMRSSKDKEDTRDKLILCVSNPPNDADIIVQKALKAFDATVEVRTISGYITPRLDAIEYNLSVYRGKESILGFIADEQRRKART